MSHSTPRREPATEDTKRRVRVGVGDFAVTADGATLTTSGLGSCVAVALVDPHAGVRGLLHAMLPAAGRTETPAPRPAKYVDTGVERVLADLHEAGAARRRMEARVVGGAEMLDLAGAVGPRNVEQAEEALSTAGIPIVGTDVGGSVGRTVRFRNDGRVAVRAADGFERTV